MKALHTFKKGLTQAMSPCPETFTGSVDDQHQRNAIMATEAFYRNIETTREKE